MQIHLLASESNSGATAEYWNSVAYGAAKASPLISPAASPVHNYVTDGTKAPAAIPASTSTGDADSTKTSKLEPDMVAAPRPARYQLRSRQWQVLQVWGRYLPS